MYLILNWTACIPHLHGSIHLSKFVESPLTFNIVISSHGNPSPTKFPLSDNILVTFYVKSDTILRCPRTEPTTICTRFRHRMPAYEIYEGPNVMCPDYYLTPSHPSDYFHSGAGLCESDGTINLLVRIDRQILLSQIIIDCRNELSNQLVTKWGVPKEQLLVCHKNWFLNIHCLFCR